MHLLKIGRMMSMSGVIMKQRKMMIQRDGGVKNVLGNYCLLQRSFGATPSGISSLGGTRNMASYGGKGGAVTFPEPHMSELPIPEGPWDKHQKKMNRKNNLHLFIGLSFFLFTQTVLWNSGLVTLNATIPDLPGGNKFGGGCVPTPPLPPPSPKC